jgi:hypothetical protein
MDRKNQEILKHIRKGMRLKGKPPKVETPKSVYNRKNKHRRRSDEDPLLFYWQQYFFIAQWDKILYEY